jgi:enoyl-CoA hydratase/carnithine racemase
MSQAVLSEDRGPVRVLTMNRPRALNALNPELKQGLMEALAAAEADEKVGAVVLTGAGRAFSAGGDLKVFAGMAERADAREVERYTSLGFPRAFAAFEKPLVAAVNGLAVGWGFTVSLMCDLRVMSREASLRCGFVRVGVTPEFGSSALLPRMVGLGRALDLALTAREVSAAEALELGLASRLAEPGEVVERAVELARAIAAHPAPAVRMAKALLRHGSQNGLADTLEYEITCFRRALATPEHREAVQAMLEAIRSRG